jgi:hypothetical protein
MNKAESGNGGRQKSQKSQTVNFKTRRGKAVTSDAQIKKLFYAAFRFSPSVFIFCASCAFWRPGIFGFPLLIRRVGTTRGKSRIES